MACACKVNQEIDRIHKYYSVKDSTRTDKPRMSINKKDAAITILIYIMLLPFVPFMFLFILVYAIFSKKKMISMEKFLGFIHTVRNGKEQRNG